MTEFKLVTTFLKGKRIIFEEVFLFSEFLKAAQLLCIFYFKIASKKLF
jgi:hypothetical protein